MSLQEALERISSAVEDGRTTIGRFRESHLAALHQVLLDAESQVLDALFTETGRHRAESRLELLIVLKHIEALFGAAAFKALKGAQKKASGEGVFKKPVGSVAILATDQAPIESWAGPLATAIAAGCPAVILVPKRLASLQQVIQDVFNKLDRTSYRVVFDSDNVDFGALATDAVVVSSRDETMRQKASLAGKRALLFPQQVERGSSRVHGNMAYVSNTVEKKNLAQIARLVVRGAFVANGANLNGVDYALIHEELHAEFVDLVIAAAKDMYGADASFASGKSLPLGAKEAATAVASQTKSGKAQIVFGGSKKGDALSFTVLDNVNEASDLVRRGTLSPILPIVPVTSGEHVIAIQTSSPSSTCFVFANTPECEYFARELDTGSIFANDIPLEAILGIASTNTPIRLSTALLQAETRIVQLGHSKVPNVFAPFPASSVQAITKVWPGRAALQINRKAHNNSFVRAFFPQGLLLTAGSVFSVILGVIGYGGYLGISKLLQYRSSVL